MGTIQIKKVEKKVVTGKVGENRQKVTKTYGKIIYRGTLGLNEMAEHIMKDGYKVKLDGIGTLYPVTTSSGVADAKDFNAQENITRVGVAFLADQSKKSLYKASAMKQGTTLSTKLYSELTGEDENSLTPDPSPTGEGSENQGGGNTGGNEGGGGFESGGD